MQTKANSSRSTAAVTRRRRARRTIAASIPIRRHKQSSTYPPPSGRESQKRSSSVALAASCSLGYVEAALASDGTAGTRTPPSFRAPTGALEDSFYLASGRQLWDASLITSRVLIIRSERDFWSRPEDVELLREHLVHAREVRSVVLPQATHYVHLDRPEAGRAAFLEEVRTFLGDGSGSANGAP